MKALLICLALSLPLIIQQSVFSDKNAPIKYWYCYEMGIDQENYLLPISNVYYHDTLILDPNGKEKLTSVFSKAVKKTLGKMYKRLSDTSCKGYSDISRAKEQRSFILKKAKEMRYKIIEVTIATKKDS